MLPGDWTKLGATLTPEGVHFAVFAPRATRVELCLFGCTRHTRAEKRLTLPTVSHGVHAGFMPGLGSGAVYGFRAHGPWEPTAGLRFNPRKLLLDPYASQVVGEVEWVDGLSGHLEDSQITPHLGDSAPFVPKAAVVDHAFDWEGDVPPRVPWSETVIYETHVKGVTATHSSIPSSLRGTYLGLAHPVMIEHLTSLGVTAVQLLPVQVRISERRLAELGLSNYWGYGSLGFFAPDPRFATAPGREVLEFKEMVRSLHSAGIEVLLDVVYNHTIEGDEDGPQLSLRGLANELYYRLRDDEPASHIDWSGCGNTLDLSSPPCLRLVLDSLRTWVHDYHVDGFRFDLAPALFRGPEGEFQPRGVFAAAVSQDPILAGSKLIAEPWDLGPDGYRLGDFPRPWREWNDQFRDTVRRFWRGDDGQVPHLARRLGGSSDRFGSQELGHAAPRGPTASINYVACHDGFTLADVVAYEQKHNDANGEQNRDGSDHNWSSSWGGEGPPSSRAQAAVRSRVVRSMIGTVLLSLGVPMIAHGDEIGRTQHGNNNAYCQDNPVAWVDWDAADKELLSYISRLTALRRSHPVFSQRQFLTSDRARWLCPSGIEMRTQDWESSSARTVGLLLLADDAASDSDALLLANASDESVPFTVPEDLTECQLVLDSSRPDGPFAPWSGAPVNVPAHTLIVLLVSRASTLPQPTG